MAEGLKINHDQKDPGAWGGGDGDLAREPRARRWRDVSAAGGGEKEGKLGKENGQETRRRGGRDGARALKRERGRGVLESRHVHGTQTCSSHFKWQSDKLESWLKVTEALLSLNGSVSPAQQVAPSSLEVSQMPELSALCWGPPVFTSGSKLSHRFSRYHELLRAEGFHTMPVLLLSAQKPSRAAEGRAQGTSSFKLVCLPSPLFMCQVLPKILFDTAKKFGNH